MSHCGHAETRPCSVVSYDKEKEQRRQACIARQVTRGEKQLCAAHALAITPFYCCESEFFRLERFRFSLAGASASSW
jgi:hypothetical protein